MKKCIRKRGSGKTETLIKVSAEKQIPILVASTACERDVLKKAREMGLEIPQPLHISEIVSKNFQNETACVPNLLIDDAECVLSILLSRFKVQEVYGISMSYNEEDKFE